jgi:type IV secretion system protein TrbJ
LVQNTLTAIRTMEQINNQINQLQNEAQMLMNQARNLTNLDFNIVNRLRSTLATTERLIAEAQGLAYDVQSMDATFSRLYPEQYAATISGDRMTHRTHANAGRTRSMVCIPRCGCRHRCRRT